MAEMATLKAELAAMKAASAQQPQPKPNAPKVPELVAAALKARLPIDQPPAKFGNARQNALHYKQQAKLYKTTEAEKDAWQAEHDKVRAAYTAAQTAFLNAPAGDEAARDKRDLASKVLRNSWSLQDIGSKEYYRYRDYYFGTFASQKASEDIRRFLVWRYYVYELAEGDDGYEPCKPKPIGLLNPHAYFAARRQGRHDFLSFVDKTQPAPKLPRSEEKWPFNWDNMHRFEEHKNDDEYDDWTSSEDDECTGCHFCNPEAYRLVPPEATALPANHVLVLRYTTRAHSSGYENNGSKIFGSYESASRAIMREFEEGGMALEYWDEDDCFEEDGDLEALPKPTIAWACKQFSPVALAKIHLKGAGEHKLYGPYSEFCCHHPYELHIEMCKVE